MIRLKVCVLGSTGVGKTSLVNRFVSGAYDASYLTTLGVRVEAKKIVEETLPVDVILWELAGGDENLIMLPDYLFGADACLLVADVTAPRTFRTALRLLRFVEDFLGTELPRRVVLNKTDLLGEGPEASREWELRRVAFLALAEREGARLHAAPAQHDMRNPKASPDPADAVWAVSAKSGWGVEDALRGLVREALGREGRAT